MKTKAAILVETGKPLEIAEIDIPDLKQGQVIVEIIYSGVCHTQLLEARGYRGEDRFLPHCLGHEGGGVVKEIGDGVTKVSVGDKVILSWIKGSGIDVPGTVYNWDGKKVNSGAITTFGTYQVISENRLTVMPDDIDPQSAALLGCAIPTGVGVVFNTAQPKPGQSLAVFGTGGIGLCAINGAAISGCHPIIAVDLLDTKLELAKKMGATHVINSDSVNPVDAIKEICAGGVDFAIEATGLPAVMVQALESVHMQGGTAVVCGNAHFGETINLNPGLLNQGKRLLGTWGGDSHPDRDYPRFAKLLAAGKLNIEPLISRVYSLDEVNAALDDLEAGRVARPVIDMKR